MFTLMFSLLIFEGVVQVRTVLDDDLVNKYFRECPSNNRSAELQLLPDVDGHTQLYLHTYMYRPFIMYCCATGYSYSKWYKDGMEFGPSDYSTFEYSNDVTREQVYWYSLSVDDCAKDPLTPFYTCIFTCEVYSVDGQDSISRNISILLYYEHATLVPQSVPEFTEAKTEEECLEEGQDLHVHCQLQYDEIEPDYPKYAEILLENGTDLIQLINYSLPYDTRRIQYQITNVMYNPVDYNITIRNVTADLLDQTYTCSSKTNPDIFRTFYVAKCDDQVVNVTKLVRKESRTSLRVGLPLAAIVFLAIIGVILLLMFNVYANLWYRTHIVQRFQKPSGNYKYDVYFIYKDITHPTVFNSIQLLEKSFDFKLCLPDRDFTTGSMTPELISDNLSSSEKVVAFLSNDMFTAGRAHDWSDMSLSLALALNRPVVIFLLEEIDTAALKDRKEIKAALKILNCVKNSSGEENTLSHTFSKHFNVSV